MGKCQSHAASGNNECDDHPELRLKSTMLSDAEEEEDDDSSIKNSTPSALSIFNEDILLSILSYVADVPFEMTDSVYGIESERRRAPTDSYSTLTHTLPLVSKQFYNLTSTHDLYWKAALLRLVKKEPNTWGEGLKRIIFDAKCDEIRDEIMERNRNRAAARGGRRDKRTKNGQLNNEHPPQSVVGAEESKAPVASSVNSSKTDNATTKEEELIEEACQAIQNHPPNHHTATSSGMYQCLYQSIFFRHMRYRAPMFCMRSTVKLGDAYGLHFFEPRYRLLISEVMANFPVQSRRGQRISPMIPRLFPPSQPLGAANDGDIKASTLDLLEKNDSLLQDHHMPTFIHAHHPQLRKNVPATIVQVQLCAISPDGSADVLLKPIAYVWLEEIWERPGTGGLLEARGIRMGKEASDAYERWCGMMTYGSGDGRGRGQQLPIP